ncbi:MAG: hypothetical protein HUJ61_02835, partial [Bacilli bacterium]|nr:hypothetical protein [Bacilli bacterium]
MARKVYYLLLMTLVVFGASLTYDMYICMMVASSLNNNSTNISRLISQDGGISEQVI